jgi:hypothetical protein
VQKLDVVAKLFPLVLSGEKTSTIRFREPPISVGAMIYWCDGDSENSVTVWVQRCTNMPLLEAAGFVGKAEDWPDEIMLKGMRVHYPLIELTDIVQVVEHLSPEQSRPYIARTKDIN